VRRVRNGALRQAFGNRESSVERGRLRLAPSNNRLQLTRSARGEVGSRRPRS
jgi:hypothetical protein